MEFQTHSYHFLLMVLSGLLAVTLSAHTHTSKGDYRQLLEFQSGQSGQFSQCHLNNKHSSVFKEKSRRWGVRNEEEFEREKVMLAIVIQDVCVRVRSGGFIRRTPGWVCTCSHLAWSWLHPVHKLLRVQISVIHSARMYSFHMQRWSGNMWQQLGSMLLE